MKPSLFLIGMLISAMVGCIGPLQRDRQSLDEMLLIDQPMPIYGIESQPGDQYRDVDVTYRYFSSDSDGEYLDIQFSQKPGDGDTHLFAVMEICTHCVPYFPSLNPTDKNYAQFQASRIRKELLIPWTNNIYGSEFNCGVSIPMPDSDKGMCLVWENEQHHIHVIYTILSETEFEEFLRSLVQVS